MFSSNSLRHPQRRRECSPDPQVRGRPFVFGDQRIGGLLDAIVEKGVAAVLAQDETRPNGFPKRRVDLLLGFPEHPGQGCDRAAVAEACELLQRGLCDLGQPPQLLDHQIHDVVGKALGPDPFDVPPPGEHARIEGDQPFLCQRSEKLDREKGIAVGLLMHQFGKRLGEPLIASKRVRDQPADIAALQRRQHDVGCSRTRLADRCQHADQRMHEAYLVVPVGADQQKVLYLGVCDKVIEQIETGGVEPLQVVQEQRERMLRPRERANETPEHHLKTVLPVLRRKLRNRRLLPDDERKLRNQVGHDLSVRTKRLQQ